MTSLTDLDTILLSAAAQRETGNVLPLPESAATAGARLAKSITNLLRGGYAEERETTQKTAIHRNDGDVAYGVFITGAGNTAIGIDDAAGVTVLPPAAAPAPTKASKSSTVIAMLQRAEGATVAELICATGWLPHTTRAALTGIRKKGHAIEKSKREDTTCNRIAGEIA